MDYEIRRIYKAISNFGDVSGVDEIIHDMENLNNKIGEYRNMQATNSYLVPSVICELDACNKDVAVKYDSYFKTIDMPKKNYNINVFGGSDHYTAKLEDSMSKLGRVAIKKICDHFNIECTDENISGTNTEVMEYFNRAMDMQVEDSIGDKMSFKVSYND